jgi:hypothetical protein
MAFLALWPAPGQSALNAVLLALPGAKMGDWLIGPEKSGGGHVVRRVLWQHHFWTMDGPVGFADFRKQVMALSEGFYHDTAMFLYSETFVSGKDDLGRLADMEKTWMTVFDDKAGLAWVDLFSPRLESFLARQVMETLPPVSGTAPGPPRL